MSASSSSPTPGYLVRPLSRTQPSDVRFPDSRENATEYFQAVNLGPGRIEKPLQHFAESAGHGPSPVMYPCIPQFYHEVSAFGQRAVSEPTANQESQFASTGIPHYGQNEYDNSENWDTGASSVYGSTDGRGDERYDPGVYSTQGDVRYIPISGSSLNTSASVWPPARPVPEFQPMAEFPTAEHIPAGRCIYVAPHPGLETPPMMYSLASGGAPWDFRGAAVDYYSHGFSVPNSAEMHASVMPAPIYPPSTLVQDDTQRQGLSVSGNQSAVSAGTSSNVVKQSYADIIRSSPRFQQNDRGVLMPGAERSDIKAESRECSETAEHHTAAGTFRPGNFSCIFKPIQGTIYSETEALQFPAP